MSYQSLSRARWVVLASALWTLTFALPAVSGVHSASIGAATAALTVSIGSASVVVSEKGQPTITFPVTLSQPATSRVTVTYRTRDGSAKEGRDYRRASGTVTFAVDRGSRMTPTVAFFPVGLLPSRSAGGAGGFSVKLSNPSGAVLGNSVGLGQIVGRASGKAVRVSAADMRVYGGTSGPARIALMRMTLSRPITHTIAVKYKITAGSAKANKDFVAPMTGTVKIRAGSFGGWVPIKVVSGSSAASPKQFSFRLVTAVNAVISRSTGSVTIVPEPDPAPSDPPPPSNPPPGGLVFDEEFNGTSVNLSKWSTGWFGGSKPVNGSETACYDPRQNEISGGYLHMTAIASNACGMKYATGFVDTRNSFTFTTGTMTVRAYLPGDSRGVFNWPAIWTDGTGTWPNTGESDVMEGLSGRATCTYHSPSGGDGCGVRTSYVGWHTFGETVTPGKVVYSYDGQTVGTVTNGTVGNHPHFIILSNQMGNYGGPVVTPTEMLVDWVRVSR